MGTTNIEMFTALADKYGDSINTIEDAKTFFDDFMSVTNGQVIVDFLDADNDDHIENIAFDHNSGLITIYTRIPEKDSVLKEMRRMALPCDIYSILIRFKSIRFVRIKDNKCLAIVVNGYTMKRKMIEKYGKECGSIIKGYDEKSSFFTSNVLMEYNKEYEYMRAVKTPITSFWLLPKEIILHPQESEKYLFLYNVEALKIRLKRALDNLQNSLKTTTDHEEIDDFIKMYGNQIRTVAEALFKLILCFYNDKYDFKEKNKEYNDRLLGDLINPLKKHIYTSEDDKLHFSTIVRVANELSHDSGLPVKITDIGELYMWLQYYISDFNKKILSFDNRVMPEVPAKPSPSDYIDEHLKKWDFSDIIADIVQTTSGSCTYRLKTTSNFIDVFLLNNKIDYLCKDGFIKTLNLPDVSEALEVGSREEVVALIKAVDIKVKSDCERLGFNEELAFISWDVDIIRKTKPSHLFTLEEIKKLMADADDSKNNKLVIDEQGYAHIITVPGPENLYPVSIETWCAGNGYVGKDSSLSDAEDAYHLCLSLWLDYLETDNRQYNDWYRIIDVDKKIEEIKKYY